MIMVEILIQKGRAHQQFRYYLLPYRPSTDAVCLFYVFKITSYEKYITSWNDKKESIVEASHVYSTVAIPLLWKKCVYFALYAILDNYEHDDAREYYNT